jgi:predicted phage terminase large subunit-like protein
MAGAPLTAEEEVELIELLEASQPKTSLEKYITEVSPHLPPPRHLRLIIGKLEEATRRPIRLCVSMPPRHAKTTLMTHAYARWMQWSPADTHAYTSYNDEQARDKSRIIRDLAVTGGVELGDATRLNRWMTEQGGGLIAAGLRSGITGKGVNAMFGVDDPFKNRVEANSRHIREQVYEMFREVVMTRLEEVKTAASVVVIHTRWHPQDLIGRLIEDGDFEVINIPALSEGDGDPLGRPYGEALWEEFYSREYLEALRRTMGAYSFDAIYQGRPRPKGAKVFNAPHYYDPENTSFAGCRTGIGADPAATEDTSNDFSAAVAGRFMGSNENLKLYVTDVYHHQKEIPQFVADLRQFIADNDGSAAAIEGAGVGKSVFQMLRNVDRKLRLKESPAIGDKFTRAQALAAAWNDGRVLVPLGNPPWLKDFLAEMEDFTGVGDEVDDQVDAIVHLWNAGPGGSPYRSHGPAGNRRI